MSEFKARPNSSSGAADPAPKASAAVTAAAPASRPSSLASLPPPKSSAASASSSSSSSSSGTGTAGARRAVPASALDAFAFKGFDAKSGDSTPQIELPPKRSPSTGSCITDAIELSDDEVDSTVATASSSSAAASTRTATRSGRGAAPPKKRMKYIDSVIQDPELINEFVGSSGRGFAKPQTAASSSSSTVGSFYSRDDDDETDPRAQSRPAKRAAAARPRSASTASRPRRSTAKSNVDYNDADDDGFIAPEDEEAFGLVEPKPKPKSKAKPKRGRGKAAAKGKRSSSRARKPASYNDDDDDEEEEEAEDAEASTDDEDAEADEFAFRGTGGRGRGGGGDDDDDDDDGDDGAYGSAPRTKRKRSSTGGKARKRSSSKGKRGAKRTGASAAARGVARAGSSGAINYAEPDMDDADLLESDEELAPARNTEPADDRIARLRVQFILGRRSKKADPALLKDNDDDPEYEYFVKWHGKGYVHCSWENVASMERQPMGKSRLSRIEKKFQELGMTEGCLNKNYDDDEDGVWFNPTKMEVDRIIARRPATDMSLSLPELKYKLQYVVDAEEQVELLKEIETVKAKRERARRSRSQHDRNHRQTLSIPAAAADAKSQPQASAASATTGTAADTTPAASAHANGRSDKEEMSAAPSSRPAVAAGPRTRRTPSAAASSSSSSSSAASGAAGGSNGTAHDDGDDGASDEQDYHTDKWEYLVKWKSCGYEECTWERPSTFLNSYEIDRFDRFEQLPDPKTYSLKTRAIANGDARPHKFVKFDETNPFVQMKPKNVLREYQLEGLNWLAHSWHEGRNVVLADEMGLGKTVQAVSFLRYLSMTQNMRGPFLVVCPLSTSAHWQREFEGWTDFSVLIYHGSAAARQCARDYEFPFGASIEAGGGGPDEDRLARIPNDVYRFNVIITTYEVTMQDAEWLQPIEWQALIVDEAHRMKNINSRLFAEMWNFTYSHCVFLTGTPIQNDMKELWAILHFLNRDIFPDLAAFESAYDVSDSKTLDKLHEALKPYLLRRVKADVEKNLPPREETLIEVEQTPLQAGYYKAVFEKNTDYLLAGSTAHVGLMNIAMQLRKVCNHPYLLDGVEEKVAALGQNRIQANERMIKASGKLVLLDKLLTKLQKEGHKVLIFSQMTRVLDILEDYLRHRQFIYERLDGSVKGLERQESIDRFSKAGSDRFVFLLCTKAGGLGINLVAADTVIIYDSDWNPQNDIQAQARAHRIGQTKTVRIYRLITARTYESDMFTRASKKLGLDQAILYGFQPTNKKEAAAEKKELEMLIKHGAWHAFKDFDETKSRQFSEADIDQILEKNTKLLKFESSIEAGSTFSKASFDSTNKDEKLDDEQFQKAMTDPRFWSQHLGLTKQKQKQKPELMVNGKRVRKAVQYAKTRDDDDDDFDVSEAAETEATDANDSEYDSSEDVSEIASESASGTGNAGTGPSSSKRSRPSPKSPAVEDDFLIWSRDERDAFLDAFTKFGFGRWPDMRIEFPSLARKSDSEMSDYAIQVLACYYRAVVQARKDSKYARIPALFLIEQIKPFIVALWKAQFETQPKAALPPSTATAATTPTAAAAAATASTSDAGAAATSVAASPAKPDQMSDTAPGAGAAAPIAETKSATALPVSPSKPGRDLLAAIRSDKSLVRVDAAERIEKEAARVLAPLDGMFAVHCQLMIDNPQIMNARYPFMKAIVSPAPAATDAASAASSSAAAPAEPTAASSSSAAATVSPTSILTRSDFRIDIPKGGLSSVTPSDVWWKSGGNEDADLLIGSWLYGSTGMLFRKFKTIETLFTEYRASKAAHALASGRDPAAKSPKKPKKTKKGSKTDETKSADATPDEAVDDSEKYRFPDVPSLTKRWKALVTVIQFTLNRRFALLAPAPPPAPKPVRGGMASYLASSAARKLALTPAAGAGAATASSASPAAPMTLFGPGSATRINSWSHQDQLQLCAAVKQWGLPADVDPSVPSATRRAMEVHNGKVIRSKASPSFLLTDVFKSSAAGKSTAVDLSVYTWELFASRAGLQKWALPVLQTRARAFLKYCKQQTELAAQKRAQKKKVPAPAFNAGDAKAPLPSSASASGSMMDLTADETPSPGDTISAASSSSSAAATAVSVPASSLATAGGSGPPFIEGNQLCKQIVDRVTVLHSLRDAWRILSPNFSPIQLRGIRVRMADDLPASYRKSVADHDFLLVTAALRYGLWNPHKMATDSEFAELFLFTPAELTAAADKAKKAKEKRNAKQQKDAKPEAADSAAASVFTESAIQYPKSDVMFNRLRLISTSIEDFIQFSLLSQQTTAAAAVAAVAAIDSDTDEVQLIPPATSAAGIATAIPATAATAAIASDDDDDDDDDDADPAGATAATALALSPTRQKANSKMVDLPVDAKTGLTKVPVKIGRLTVIKFGKIDPHFHTALNLWPIGYQAQTEYESWLSPHKVIYLMEVKLVAGAVAFYVTPTDDTKNPQIATTPSGAWGQVLARVRDSTFPNKSTAINGAAMFGLSLPTVRKVLEFLPNAELCTRYKFQFRSVTATTSTATAAAGGGDGKLADDDFGARSIASAAVAAPAPVTPTKKRKLDSNAPAAAAAGPRKKLSAAVTTSVVHLKPPTAEQSPAKPARGKSKSPSPSPTTKKRVSSLHSAPLKGQLKLTPVSVAPSPPSVGGRTSSSSSSSSAAAASIDDIVNDDFE